MEALFSSAVGAGVVLAAVGLGVGVSAHENRWLRLEKERVQREQFLARLSRMETNAAGADPSVQSDSDQWRRRLRAGPGNLAKRLFDLLAASALLVFLAPLMALVAVAIRLESKGPSLYRQKRVGFQGEVFEIFKFRSMREDAEIDGAKWAAADDVRVTRVGRWIRRLRIDELPQAINVLSGEMSFVGPRPERPEFTGLLETEIPNYHMRHVVKPGITGWAQVKHCYTASVEGAREKLKYDLYYIDNFSLKRDVLIVLMTVRVALFGIGSR